MTLPCGWFAAALGGEDAVVDEPLDEGVVAGQERERVSAHAVDARVADVRDVRDLFVSVDHEERDGGRHLAARRVGLRLLVDEAVRALDGALHAVAERSFVTRDTRLQRAGRPSGSGRAARVASEAIADGEEPEALRFGETVCVLIFVAFLSDVGARCEAQRERHTEVLSGCLRRPIP